MNMKKGILFIFAIVCLIMNISCKDSKGGTGGVTKEKPSPTKLDGPIEQSGEPSGIRVYIDNSGSMRGYAEGQNAVFISAISDLKSLKNGEAYFWGAKPQTPIKGIIGEALAKNPFAGLDTPFPTIIAQLEHEAAGNDALTFIVTDGIIGVNSKQAQYLRESLGQIKNDIRDSARVENGMAISVFRLQSGYSNKSKKSFYYTHKNIPVKLDSAKQRPFFVIAIGKPHVQCMIHKINSEGSLSSYKQANSMTFGLHEHNKVLHFSDKLAFNQDGDTYVLTKKKGEFNLVADLPECLVKDLGESYLQQHLEVLLNDSKKNISFSINGNTLSLKCNEIHDISAKANVITVRLKKIIPDEWLKWSSDDDSNIAKDMMEQQHTFALAYLIKGLYEATDDGRMLIDTTIKFTK